MNSVLSLQSITGTDLAPAQDVSPSSAAAVNGTGTEIANGGPRDNNFPSPHVAIPPQREASSPNGKPSKFELVDITTTLENHHARFESVQGSQSGFTHGQFEPYSTWVINGRAISTTRVEQLPQPQRFTIAVHASHPSPSSRTEYGVQGRAQAFEIVTPSPPAEKTVSLAGLFDQSEYFSRESSWNLYLPAHMAVSTLPPVFDLSSPEWRELTGSDDEHATAAALQPPPTVQATDAAVGDADRQSDEIRTDRRAATMIFSVYAAQQLWHSDRRKPRWASALSAAWNGGIDLVLKVTDLACQAWDFGRRRWQERQVWRHARRRILPAASSRAERQA
jgi:hypothetical protein